MHHLMRCTKSGTYRKNLREYVNNIVSVFESAGISEPEESAAYIVAKALNKKTVINSTFGLICYLFF